MIDNIILAEFDVNQGNTIKLEYPLKLDLQEMVLSSFLIPEGSHNIITDCFLINLKNANPAVKSGSKSMLEEKINTSKLAKAKFLNIK